MTEHELTAPPARYPDAPKTSAQILADVEALGPKIDGMIDDIRKAGCLPSTLMEDLRAAGVLRSAFPKAWGGTEVPFVDQVRMVESLARHDASVGWNVMILMDSGFFAGRFAIETALEIFPSMDSGVAVSGTNPGRAEPVDGGFRLNGRWRFGSGVRNADVVVCMCEIHGPDGPELGDDGKPRLYLFFVPQNEVTIHDNWQTIGLQGTGSSDYSVEDVFVPAHHSFVHDYDVRDDMPPLSRVHDLLMISQFGVLLGVTDHIISEAEAEIEKKVSPATGKPLREEYRVLVGLEEARALLGAARAYVFELAAEFDAMLATNETVQREHQAKLHRVSATLGILSRSAAEKAIEVVGTSAAFETKPYERLYEDLRVACTHHTHQHRWYERSGHLMMGEVVQP